MRQRKLSLVEGQQILSRRCKQHREQVVPQTQQQLDGVVQEEKVGVEVMTKLNLVRQLAQFQAQ